MLKPRDFLVEMKHKNPGMIKIILSERFYEQLKKDLEGNVSPLGREGTIYMTPHAVDGAKSSFEFHYQGGKIIEFNF